MRSHEVLVVLGFLLLSGCAGQDQDPAADQDLAADRDVAGDNLSSAASGGFLTTTNATSNPSAVENETSGPAVAARQSHEGWLNSSRTSVAVSTPVYGSSNGLQGKNCVWFDVGVLRSIKTGFVEATWVPNNPSVEELELVVAGNESLRVSGPSPLRIDLVDFAAEDQGLSSLLLFLQAQPPVGAAVQLPLSIHWQFSDYGGDKDLAWDESGCGA